MERLTTKHVEHRAQMLARALGHGARVQIHSNAPGDGCRRFEVCVLFPGDAQYSYGRRLFYALGARDAVDRMGAALEALEVRDQLARSAQAVTP